mmetsp:Transcript_35298/g.77294  ORF Transcript_35298/g.77294 Transcript_35298/m.77294 type:complete len:216 (+) Transcript_35298:517-1164(+)
MDGLIPAPPSQRLQLPHCLLVLLQALVGTGLGQVGILQFMVSVGRVRGILHCRLEVLLPQGSLSPLGIQPRTQDLVVAIQFQSLREQLPRGIEFSPRHLLLGRSHRRSHPLQLLPVLLGLLVIGVKGQGGSNQLEGLVDVLHKSGTVDGMAVIQVHGLRSKKQSSDVFAACLLQNLLRGIHHPWKLAQLEVRSGNLQGQFLPGRHTTLLRIQVAL